MDIGIIGAGSVAQAFAHHALQVGHTIKISNSRGPSTLRDTVHTLGAGVTAVTQAEAATSEVVLLAVPWDDVVSVLTHLPPWQQQILIDATNPFHGRAGTFTLADARHPGRPWCTTPCAFALWYCGGKCQEAADAFRQAMLIHDHLPVWARLHHLTQKGQEPTVSLCQLLCLEGEPPHRGAGVELRIHLGYDWCSGVNPPVPNESQ